MRPSIEKILPGGLEDTLERITDSFAALDENWNYTYMNKAAGITFNRNPETIIGKNFWAEFPEAIGQPVEKALRKAMEEHVYVYRQEYFEPYGRWYENHFYPSENGISILSRDITEKKKAEIELEESRAKYRAFFENSLDGILLTTLDGKILAANPAACSIFRMTEEEICQEGRAGLVDITDPQLPIFIEERRKNGKMNGEISMIRKDGTKFPAEISSAVFKDINGEERTTMIIRDVSERKKAEELLNQNRIFIESIINASPDIIYIYDIEEKKNVYVNEGIQRNLGYTDAEIKEMGNRVIPLLMHPEDFDDYLNNTIPRYNTAKDKEIISHEFRMKDKNGNWHWLYTKESIFLRKPDGTPKQIFGITNDITERKKVEDEVKRNEKRFQAMVENNDSVITLFDENFQPIYRTPSAERIGGWTDEDRGKKTIQELIHPDDVEYLKSVQNEVLNKPGKLIPFLFRFRHKDGTYLYPEGVVINLLHDSDVKAIVANFRDVTEHKKAEEELQKSEQRFQAMVENNDSVISLLDENFQPIYQSPSAIRVSGWTEEERRQTTLLELTHPDDLEYVKKTMKEMLVNPGKTISYSFRVRRKNGNYLYAEGVATNLLHDDTVKAIVANFRDITEHKKAEEEIKEKAIQLQTLSDNLPDTMMYQVIREKDGKMKFIYVSKAVELLTGKTPEEVIKNPEILYNLIHEEDYKKILDAERISFQTMSPFNMEVRSHSVTGKLRWLHIRSVPRRLADGNVIWDGIHTDITERKKAEKALIESENHLRTIFDTEPECIKLLGPNGELLDMNPSGLAMIEADNLEMVKGKSVLGNVSPHHRDAFANLTKNVFNGESGELEFEIEGLKGTRRWLETHAVPLKNAEGKIISLLGVTRDVTERKKAEEALHESEEKYRQIVETSQEGIFRTDENYCINFANKKFCEILEYSLEELIGHDPLSYLDSKDIEKAMAVRKERRKGSDFGELEYNVKTKTGKSILLSFSASPILDKEGKFTGGTGVVTDITDRKKAEEQIVKEKELSDSIINSLPGIFYLFDAGKNLLRWNKNFELVSGYTAEEIRRVKPIDFFEGDGRNLVQENFDEVFRMGEAAFEANFVSKTGEKIPYYFTGLLVNYEGRPCLIGTGIDMSERKKADEEIRKSELRYRSLIEQASDAIMITDQAGNFLDVNTSFCTLFSYTKEELIGVNIRKLIDPEQLKRKPMRFEELLIGNQVFSERNMLHKNGTIIQVEANVKMLPDGRILAIARDITERKKAEEEIKQTSEQLRQLTAHLQIIREEERKRIGREIHDELGQQLTAIKMDVAWIDKKTSKEDIIKTKLKNIITLLDGSNLSIRKILNELRLAVLDDHGLIDALEWLGRQFTSQTRIPLSFHSSESDLKLEETVATCIFRVFQEALTNITKYARAGKVVSSLNCTNDKITLEIEDNGKGFDTAMLKNKTSFGILGMKERVTSLNGDFKLISSPGSGTKIIISLPLKP